MTFERRIEMSPSFDKRSEDHGIGAVRIWFYLIGPKGAVQWQIGTNWYVPSAQEHLRSLPPSIINSLENGLGGGRYQPQAWDLGFHAREPRYYQDKDSPTHEHCDVLDGPCWYDGSSLNAEPLIQPFLEGGSEAVWKKLAQYYHEVFETEDV